LPPGEHVSDEKFAEIASAFMKKMRFSELHPWTFVLHKEKDHLHGHIIASRISFDSRLWHGKNEAKTAIQACREIEKEFGLTQVLSTTDKEKVKKMSVKEAKKFTETEPTSQASVNANLRAARKGTHKNDLSQIRATVFECMHDARNEQEFREQISRHGLEAQYRTREDGQIYGWKLRESGAEEWLSATSISRAFSWPQIIARVNEHQSNVQHVPTNDIFAARAEADKKNAAIKKTIQSLNDAQLRELHAEALKIRKRGESSEFVPVAKGMPGMPGLLQKLLNLVVRVLTLGKYGLPQVQNPAPSRADDSVENIHDQACTVLIQKIEEEQKMRARMSMLKQSAHASPTKTTAAIPHQNQDFEPDADECDNEYQRERGG